MLDNKIENNAFACRFELALESGMAKLDYRVEGDTIYLQYVEVPIPEQGRGIAGRLSRAALEFARDQGLKVAVRCPVIAAFMRRHPELLEPML